MKNFSIKFAVKMKLLKKKKYIKKIMISGKILIYRYKKC